jgi:hypothetical protein
LTDPVPPRPKLADELRVRIMEVAVKATAEDRKQITNLIARAKDGTYGTELISFTPAMAAIIFLENNPHNRDWSAQWTLEVTRRMKAGQWRKNNALPGFYTTGQLEDAQHRIRRCRPFRHHLDDAYGVRYRHREHRHS